MKYILMMNTMKAGCAGFSGWEKKDVQAHIAYMIAMSKELGAAGELVSAEGLTFQIRPSWCGPARMGCRLPTVSFPRARMPLATGSWMLRRRNEPTLSPRADRLRRTRRCATEHAD